jgi:hypothetical protein
MCRWMRTGRDCRFRMKPGTSEPANPRSAPSSRPKRESHAMKTPDLKLKNLNETRIPRPSFRPVYTFFTYSPGTFAAPPNTLSLDKNTLNRPSFPSAPRRSTPVRKAHNPLPGLLYPQRLTAFSSQVLAIINSNPLAPAQFIILNSKFIIPSLPALSLRCSLKSAAIRRFPSASPRPQSVPSASSRATAAASKLSHALPYAPQRFLTKNRHGSVPPRPLLHSHQRSLRLAASASRAQTPSFRSSVDTPKPPSTQNCSFSPEQHFASSGDSICPQPFPATKI